MSIYENISIPKMLLKRPFRVFSNVWSCFRSGPKTGKPFKVKFESSSICNLKCVMCPLTKGLTRKQGLLKFENFKKVFDEVKFPYVNLTGLGEPLLNPDIFKIINYTIKKGSLVKLDTNATLLNKENIRKLILSNPTFISVSLDGIKRKSYESIRVGAEFKKVIFNLKNLINYRNKVKSRTQIHVFFVLQKDNQKDLIEYIKFCNLIGVDAINGTIAMSFGKVDNQKRIILKKENLVYIKKELEKIKKNSKLKINIEGIEEFLSNENSSREIVKKPCFYPWYNPCITWDGYVVPCDVHCDNEIVLGNAFKEKFMKIWNNKKSQEFRKQLIKGRGGICSKCSVDETFILNKLSIFYKIPLIRNLSKRKGDIL